MTATARPCWCSPSALPPVLQLATYCGLGADAGGGKAKPSPKAWGLKLVPERQARSGRASAVGATARAPAHLVGQSIGLPGCHLLLVVRVPKHAAQGGRVLQMEERPLSSRPQDGACHRLRAPTGRMLGGRRPTTPISGPPGEPTTSGMEGFPHLRMTAPFHGLLLGNLCTHLPKLHPPSPLLEPSGVTPVPSDGGWGATGMGSPA